MKFQPKQSDTFKPVPAGTHVAICTGVIDFGLQPGSDLYPEPKHQVYLRFELPGERISYTKDGQEIEGPMSIGRTFTASMNVKAALRKFIESWRGVTMSDEQAYAFDLSALLGTRCLLNVTHVTRGDRTYANIMTATPLPKGMTSTESQHNASVEFSLDAPNQDALAALPAWMRDKIAARIRPGQKPPQAAPVGASELSGSDDDIWF